MKEKLLAYLDEHEYFLLIASHVTMLIFYPFVIDSPHALLWMHVLISLILITWLYAANTHERFVIRTVLLWVIAFILTWANFLYTDTILITLMLNIVGLLFFCIILYNLIIDLHTMESINQHMIFGAVAGYLILWLIGAFVFALIEMTTPGSFTGFVWTAIGFPDFVYYSYVSMTTLGYGDIIPVGYHAQSRSVLFTIAGQMYLAILIGMLVGKYVRK
jgi:hypothetical protein